MDSTSAAFDALRPSVLQLVLKDQDALYAAYMPLLAEGGVFVPTQRSFHLGEEVYLLLQLPHDPQPHTVAGKVAWITPAQAIGSRSQGIGVQLAKSAASAALRQKIEALLGPLLASDRPTQTI
jgi:type IV pilus assembly protein PilZ